MAVRLQGIAYGDPRRGISGYYDLAREARGEINKTAGEKRETWKRRLEDLGVRVGNALVEMGDLAGAVRYFESFRGKANHEDGVLLSRLVLLYLRLGNMAAAGRYMEAVEDPDATTRSTAMLKPLFSMAEGRYEDSVTEWKEAQSSWGSEVVTQNLAVCLLYTGRLEEV